MEDDYCCIDDNDTPNDPSDDPPLAPKGTRLPITADVKYNIVARYHFDMGSLDSYVQGVLVYQSDRDSRLARPKNEIMGVLPSYSTLDLAAGFGKNDWSVDLFISNVTGEDAPLFYTAECIPSLCGVGQRYGVRVRPRTISARFTKDF